MKAIGCALSASVLLLVVQACAAPPRVGAAAPSPAVSSPAAEPVPAPSPTASPVKAGAPPAAPATLPVAFFGQPAGTYPVHLHSACNGTQKFHLTVLQGLSVGGDGSGSVEVPSSYFGRGLCVIVYTNTALSRVLTTREI